MESASSLSCSPEWRFRRNRPTSEVAAGPKRARKAGSGKSVGTVSHRPLFGLPGEQGMARETRSLPGRFMGEAEFVVGSRLYSPMTSEVRG
jgi:hypothetical protein